MSEKTVTTCDGCSAEIKVEHSCLSPIVITIKVRGVIWDAVKHACSKDCLVKILMPKAWPDLDLPVTDQTPPASNGVYR